MATPRSPYVCIADSLLDEPWPAEIKLAMVQLSCHIHARWRSDRRLTLEAACIDHPVGRADLMKIMSTLRLDSARRRLNVMGHVVSMSSRREGDVEWISWPKWAEYNRTLSRSAGARRPIKSPVRGPSASASASEEKRRARSASRQARTAAPEALDPAGVERIRGWFSDVVPGRLAECDSLIEEALGYLRTQGKTSADWPLSVLGNIRNGINRQRKRDGEQPLPTQAQARADREQFEKIQRELAAQPPRDPVLFELKSRRAPSAGGVLGGPH